MKNFWFATVTGIAVLLLGNNLFAASPDSFQQYEMQRQDINRSAMLVLGSWAVGNMLVGTYGHFNTAGQAREFHQFSFMWNVVNLGIAAYGYHQAVNADPMSLGYVDVLKEYNTLAMPTCISTPSSNRSLPGVPDWEWCSGSEVLMSVY